MTSVDQLTACWRACRRCPCWSAESAS
jgi:hypothetical protein